MSNVGFPIGAMAVTAGLVSTDPGSGCRPGGDTSHDDGWSDRDGDDGD